MSTRSYRLAVLWGTLSWFLLGMHFPIVHNWAEHGHVPRASLLVVLVALAAASIAGTWVLLRAPQRTRT